MATKKKKASQKVRAKIANPAKYPRHSLEKSLRIPLAILNQNAGKECSDQESAAFVGVSYNGPYMSEIGSAKKYGLLSSPGTKRVVVTDLAKKYCGHSLRMTRLMGYDKPFQMRQIL